MLNFALAGAGTWGRNHVRVLAELPGVNLSWIADPDPARRAAAEKQAPRARVVADLGEALADKDLDALVVASPAPTHAPLARRALDRGLHVLVEKPLAADLVSARALVRRAAACKRVLMVGHLLLYHPAVTRLVADVRRNRLGPLRYIHAQRTNLGRLRSDEGALLSLAPHDLSIMVRLFDAWPVAVSATGGRFVQPALEDVAFLSLRFPGGRLGHIHLSWLDPLKERRISVVGEKAMAIFDDMRSDARLRYVRRQADGQNKVSSPKLADREPLREELAAFAKAIRRGEPAPTPGADGARVVAVLEAAQASLEDGGAEKRLRIQ